MARKPTNAELIALVNQLRSELSAAHVQIEAAHVQIEAAKEAHARFVTVVRAEAKSARPFVEKELGFFDTREEAYAEQRRLAALCAAKAPHKTVRYQSRGEGYVLIGRTYQQH